MNPILVQLNFLKVPGPLMALWMEEKYLNGALHLMGTLIRPHICTRLTFLYDQDTELPEYTSLNRVDRVVQDHLGTISRMYRAVDIEPPLFTPMTNTDNVDQRTRHGFKSVAKLPAYARRCVVVAPNDEES
ncbi:hypothetical protein BDP27DRAFT_1371029 [Rhodocollybia butyracea]|uniref:Uncharacterized protein n=1 Tax=Rhodocollybia butyracea TaxID=206335 RepID=A0A9P5TWK2_9AGAR|nr:hypothetical protein BDP27DRAFT_1374592 [Rhodocollybia butyracea]KAF9059865.1 hypothetical protein BDP27DRAFT_1371029 [Rhodocollybia butyracea]